MKRSNTIAMLVITAALSACAANEWRTITDVKEIAATRTVVSKPNPDLAKVIVLRLQRNGQRMDVNSLAPTTVGAAKNGPPGARTLFAFTPARDKLVLFGQNVPEFKGFHQEIPVAELLPGKTFHFPVVQDDGSVMTEAFVVEKLITDY